MLNIHQNIIYKTLVSMEIITPEVWYGIVQNKHQDKDILHTSDKIF